MDLFMNISKEELYLSTIKVLDFPPTLEKNGNEKFYPCVNIKKVVLSDSVIEISTAAFRDCTGIEEVVLSEKLTILNICCFYGCTSLKYHQGNYFPESKKKVGSQDLVTVAF